jgi:uncharacterized protein
MKQDMPNPSLPWWRVPAAWLLVGGPALVVAASLVTAVIAVRGGDRPVLESPAPRADTMTPAKQARNHVATPRR